MHWFNLKRRKPPPVTGLILPGGGARNAYQVGVLKAIAEMLPDDASNPFPVICGTSSGAINASLLASSACQFKQGVGRLCGIWENFTVHKVFKDDVGTAIRNTGRWIHAFFTGYAHPARPLSILDNSPLRHHMESHIRFARIQHAIDTGDLRALAITASGYGSGRSITYYQGIGELVPWRRSRRCGVRAEITLDHLMASTAIPMVFPAVRLGDEYFGDGSMRETAPLSPALHLGANRLLIIGSRNPELEATPDRAPVQHPTPGQIAGYVFDTLFLDSLDSDLERMSRINLTIGETRDKRVEFEDTALRPIDYLMLSPTGDMRALVDRHAGELPGTVRILLKAVGAMTRGSRPLLSYLLFESGYCRELMAMGYRDAIKSRAPIMELLGYSESKSKPGRARKLETAPGIAEAGATTVH